MLETEFQLMLIVHVSIAFLPYLDLPTIRALSMKTVFDRWRAVSQLEGSLKLIKHTFEGIWFIASSSLQGDNAYIAYC